MLMPLLEFRGYDRPDLWSPRVDHYVWRTQMCPPPDFDQHIDISCQMCVDSLHQRTRIVRGKVHWQTSRSQFIGLWIAVGILPVFESNVNLKFSPFKPVVFVRGTIREPWLIKLYCDDDDGVSRNQRSWKKRLHVLRLCPSGWLKYIKFSQEYLGRAKCLFECMALWFKMEV